MKPYDTTFTPWLMLTCALAACQGLVDDSGQDESEALEDGGVLQSAEGQRDADVNTSETIQQSDDTEETGNNDRSANDDSADSEGDTVDLTTPDRSNPNRSDSNRSNSDDAVDTTTSSGASTTSIPPLDDVVTTAIVGSSDTDGSTADTVNDGPSDDSDGNNVDAGSTDTYAGTSGNPTTTNPTGTSNSNPPDPDSVAPAIRASTMAEQLADNDLLPFADTLNEADTIAHVALMQSFDGALGGCEACHVSDYSVWTAQKYVSLHMWADMMTNLRFKDGGVLFCDSCHQGQARFLDRSDSDAVTLWMQINLVDKLERVDGEPHGCETCHGEPANYELIDAWSEN
jgi:hypothetical protein